MTSLISLSISLVALMIPPGCIWLVRPLRKRLLGRAHLNARIGSFLVLRPLSPKGERNKIGQTPSLFDGLIRHSCRNFSYFARLGEKGMRLRDAARQLFMRGEYLAPEDSA